MDSFQIIVTLLLATAAAVAMYSASRVNGQGKR